MRPNTRLVIVELHFFKSRVTYPSDKVIDNGIGLGANASINLIKAFERGENVEHVEDGLGLSIAHAAPQRIHAQIMLYNNEDAADSTAEVTLSNKGICQKTLF